MLFNKNILIIILVNLFTNIANSQSIGQPNELDEQYTPKGTGPLSAESKSNQNSSKKYSSDYPKNIVKFTPTAMVRNIGIFNYERNIADNFSLTAGLGFNYNKDIIFSTIGAEVGNFGSLKYNRDELSIHTIMNKSTHNGISPYFSGGIKIFYESFFWDNYSYIEFLYFNYSNKLNFEIDNSPTTSPQQILIGSPYLKVNFSTLALKWAVQFHTEGKIQTIHELFFIGGIRTASHNSINYKETNNQSNNNTISYSIETQKNKASSFLFGIGYTFGIGFYK